MHIVLRFRPTTPHHRSPAFSYETSKYPSPRKLSGMGLESTCVLAQNLDRLANLRAANDDRERPSGFLRLWIFWKSSKPLSSLQSQKLIYSVTLTIFSASPSAQISEVQIPVPILVRRKANHIPFGASHGDPWPVKRRIALKTISQRLPLITHTISTQGDLGANASGLFSNTDPGNDLIKHA
uniref:Uncharacterized protein n=1 Tax=Coccidioides posadasii RMSCC 3488 TaxID=454284 RepID=A0A0J6FFX0_COCPO|nr:hypothetical protein CPAG_08350 [Coccidioides posadasii RMSCC 3488]